MAGSLLDLAAQLKRLGERREGGLEIGARDLRRCAPELGTQPAARVGPDRLEITRAGAEAEAVGRDGGLGVGGQAQGFSGNGWS